MMNHVQSRGTYKNVDDKAMIGNRLKGLNPNMT